ncbi:hypothetical protein, partial [Pseudomonas savastanoi]|uniref:hypothetical protein n=1 Tax=Pseudomonas savastanoi TaxID=29438 RepID=UPI001E640384
HPPDHRQDSAVTNVALCVVSAIAIEKRFFGNDCGLDYRADAPHRHAVRNALRHTQITPPGWPAI